MQNKNKTWIIGICIAIVLGIVLANAAGGFIEGLLIGLFSCLTPIVTALVAIFLLKHVMSFVEIKILFKLFKNINKKVARIISLFAALLLFLGFIFLIFYMFVPRTVDIITELINNKEKYIYQLQNEVSAILASLFGTNAEDMVASITSSLYAYIETTFNNILPQLIAVSTSTISTIGQILLGLVLAILYLIDREGVNAYVIRMSKTCMNEKIRESAKNVIGKSDRILIDFIIAKAIECVVITVCLGILMSILGVQFAFELAFIMGVLNVIPYVGYIISLFPTLLITMVYGSVSLALQTLIFVSVGYILLTSLVTPFIIGKRIRMNMIVMFLSMIIGGGLFGIVGMMIGVPIGAIISEFIKERVDFKERQMAENKLIEDASSINNVMPKKAVLIGEKIDNEEDLVNKTKVKKPRKKKNNADIDNEIQAQVNEIESSEVVTESKEKKQGKLSRFFDKLKHNFTNIADTEEDDEDQFDKK